MLISYLAAQVEVILGQDYAVRADEPEAMHKMRVATRRLRSALATFRPLLHRDVTDPVREETRWLGNELGRARDVEVQHEHLMAAVKSEPEDLVLGPVAARIEVELRSDYRAAHDRLLLALDSDRYFALLDNLQKLIGSPPLSVRARGKASPALRKGVARAGKKLYRLVAVGEPEVGEDRDKWLHEIRKAAKRVRYAAELAEPALGKSAAALALTGEAIQQILGDHQDSVVLRQTLRAIGIRMHLDGLNPFTIGRLHALQQARADQAEIKFADAWADRYAAHLRAWRHR